MEKNYDDKTMREAFGEVLRDEAYNYRNLYALSADTEKSMGLNIMRMDFPNRVFNVGICEQNMTMIAAGLASCGGKVVIATYACFASMRMLEQVRTYIACLNMDVKVISGMGGLSGGREGVSHHGIEDISIMRSIPNMAVIVAADACSTKIIAKEVLAYNGPVYLRLGRHVVPKIFSNYSFKIGRANILKEGGNDIAIICNGSIIQRVIEVGEMLDNAGIYTQIIEMPCVKPIDREAIEVAARSTGRVVTIEENNIMGGLGGAVAEVISELCPVPLLRLGIEDTYTKAGSYDELLDVYGFEPHTIYDKIMRFFYRTKLM